MKNKTLGNKLFKSGKVLIAVAGVSVIMTNAVIPVISTVSADTNKVTPVHTASNWRANDQKTVDNNMRSQGINSINDLSNYNVVWGDTLTTIANHFHTTADELKNKFNIVNADFIVAGFELSNQSQFNSIGRELLSSSITSLNKNTTAAYLQKPTNVDRRPDSNNSTSNTEQKQVVAVNHGYSVTANNNVTDKAAADQAAAEKAAADKAAADQAAADKAAADKAAADKAAADKAAAEQAAADKAAADKAAADKAAAEQAAADKAAADKAAADKAAADKAAADKAAADKAAADTPFADKAVHTIYTGTNTYLYTTKELTTIATTPLQGDTSVIAYPDGITTALTGKNAGDLAIPVTYKGQNLYFKGTFEGLTSNGLYPDGYYYALTDTAFYGVVKPTDPSVKLDAPFLNGSTWFYFFDGGSTIYSYQNNVWTGHTFLNAAADKAAAEQAAADKAAADQAAADKAAADKAAADKAAADKAAADKAAADKAAADKAAADQAAADKAAADKAAADQAAAEKAAADKAAAEKAAADKATADKAAQSNISSNFVAGNIETVGKYSKKLIVGFAGTDITPFTVTKVSVSDGSNLSVSYSEEELETLGFKPGDGNEFGGYLRPQQGSIGWDTSNLLVTATVRLQDGKVITVTHKVTPVN